VGLTEAEGLFGPRSVSWRVDRELLVLAGGSCALLMQAAHPAVAAGVAQHSTYRTDPFGRLLRTLESSFSVVFGSRSEALATIDRVNAIHRSVRGAIPETGRPYSALDPDALLWVHVTLVDTALRVYEGWVAPLSAEERDAYHTESAQVALRLGVPAEVMPATLAELRGWMEERLADGTIVVTPTAREIAATILSPSRRMPRVAWEAAHLVSLATLPPDLRRQYGIRWGARRQAGAERLARLSRRTISHLPRLLRDAPQARAAQRRVSRGTAMMAAPAR
jgi:uncharacterized protein (DUF2236 family)